MARQRGPDGRWLPVAEVPSTRGTGGSVSRSAAGSRTPAAPVAPAAPERDFLVIYEEDDDDGLPTDDHLILDVESPKTTTRGKLDVQQKLDLELSNTTNRMGTIGFVLSVVGAFLGFVILIGFALTFPDQWYDDSGATNATTAVRLTTISSVFTLILLIVGTIMTNYGRRIQARGNLTQVRIIEKSAHAKARIQ